MTKIVFKISVLSAVSLATWMTTSSILAQQQKKAVKSPAVNSSEAGTVSKSPTLVSRGVALTSRPSVQPPLGSSDGFAEMHLRSHEIVVADGVATVTAHVSIADKRQGQLYLWRLRVVGFDGLPLAGTVYDQQMFSVEENGQREVHFADTILVPSGAKRVELVLYEKTPNEGLSFLDDRMAARAHQVIRAVKLLNK